jgi:hypothetical protein
MNTIATCIVIFSMQLSVSLVAQNANVSKQKMEFFKNWEGHWKGESTIQRGQEKQKATVEEFVALKLDGTIMTVEGIGKTVDPENRKEKIVHHAFAVLNYDESAQEYKFQTYLNDGKSSAAWFKVLSETKYQWGFDVPGGKIRYTILIDPLEKKWDEIGEYSNDQVNWYKFLEMNLTRM